MKISISIWQIIGFLFTGIIGVLLHFLYDWSNNNIIIALFSPVNESIWEHLKLLFFPMLLFSLFENKYIGRENNNFWYIKLIGISAGTILIPTLYYTINGIFGVTPDWLNIIIFFLTIGITYLLETILLKEFTIKSKSSFNALLILCLIAIIFILFTFLPLHIPFFKDPITNTYGYTK